MGEQSRQAATFKAGDRVIYVPMHAYGDRHHPDCERGKVSSVGDSGIVFVRFDGAVGRLGWDGATSQGCDPESLVIESAALPVVSVTGAAS